MIGHFAQRMHQGITPEHAMFNMGGGGGGSSSTVQSIPEELKPLAKEYTNKAIGVANQDYIPYEGQRYADFNPSQYMGMGMAADRALNGSYTMNNAEGNLNQMMQGGSNPYLDQSVGKALNDVQTRVNSQFGGNNYGTTAHQETLARSLGDTDASMRGAAYQSDQANRLSAISQAPTFGNQAYTDAQHMMNVGQTMQDQQQQGLDFGYQQFQDAQNLPYKQLSAMSGVFGSNLGTQQSTTQSGGGK